MALLQQQPSLNIDCFIIGPSCFPYTLSHRENDRDVSASYAAKACSKESRDWCIKWFCIMQRLSLDLGVLMVVLETKVFSIDSDQE